MRFQSKLFGRRSRTERNIKEMHDTGDIHSLVQEIPRTESTSVPELLSLINDLFKRNKIRSILRSGLSEKLSEILEKGNSGSKREAVRLVVKFIELGEGNIILTERNTANMVRIMDGADPELRSWITYSLTEAIAIGYGWIISIEGGLEEMIDQLEYEDTKLVRFTLKALNEMEKVGFQQGMLKNGLMDRINMLRISDDPFTRSYADDLNLKLSVWIDSSSRLGADDPDKDEDKTKTIHLPIRKIGRERSKIPEGNIEYDLISEIVSSSTESTAGI